MTNLADNPSHADGMQRLPTELDRWMTEQGDPGAEIDMDAQWQAVKQGNHFAQRRAG